MYRKVSKTIMAILFLALISTFTYCESKNEFPISARDGLGRMVTVQTAPQKIVSTIPSNTEILYDLGLKNKVIAVTSHCKKTCDISGKCIIGGWSEPGIAEKIADLRPDLILAFGGLQSPLAKEMDKRNIPTFVFFPKTVDETLEQTILVGKITGTLEKAKEIVRSNRDKLNEIENKLKDIPIERRIKCLRLMSTEAMVIGGESFQSDIIKKAGGINVFKDIKDDYPIVSLEDVQEKDPDIIVFNRDDEKEAIEWFLKQEGWRDLRAAREGKFASISCDYICHPNTRTAKTVEMLARRFYPERFAANVFVSSEENYPQRIISLGPSITEELYLLGVEDKLIGCTVYCKRPEEALSKEKVATVKEVNLEKVIILNPDLVLTTPLTDYKAIEKLKNLGIKVISFSSPKNFDELCEYFLELGKIVGKEEKAKEIITRVKDKVNSIRKRVEDLPKPKVFIQVGARPLVTLTKDSFVNDFIEFAGGENIAYDSKSILYSREKVLKANPDIIIITTMGIVGEKEKNIWKKYNTLKAVKNNKIYIVDSYKFCSPTPVSFVETLEDLVDILHSKEHG